MTTNRESVRAQFPALAEDEVFLDNAGGSQVPVGVADAIRDFMLTRYVQLGADTTRSRQATDIVARAHELAQTLANGTDTGHTAFGASTSNLVARLAECYARAPHPKRNEVIVAESGHEANVGPWVRMAERGWTVRWWKIDPETQECPIEQLQNLLSDRTRIVALPHVSNLLGRIEPLEEVCRLAHGAGARVVADGVAYAPHRAVDVTLSNVDWYVFSAYKVYGPHMGVLWGKKEAFAEIQGPNHFFVPDDDPVYKFELGGVVYESCAAMLALKDYLRFLCGEQPSEEMIPRPLVERAFQHIDTLERPLTEQLLTYLADHPHVRLIGPSTADDHRVPTISFVHRRRSSREIAMAANEEGLGIRYGHFYAHRLASAFAKDPEDGVVRTSLLHYNSPAEVDRIKEFFDRTL